MLASHENQLQLSDTVLPNCENLIFPNFTTNFIPPISISFSLSVNCSLSLSLSLSHTHTHTGHFKTHIFLSMRLSLCYVSTMSLFVLPVLLGPPLSLSLSLSLSLLLLSIHRSIISSQASYMYRIVSYCQCCCWSIGTTKPTFSITNAKHFFAKLFSVRKSIFEKGNEPVRKNKMVSIVLHHYTRR